MRHGTHRLASWVFLAAYWLAAAAPVQGLVVCLESDGTVAIETAADAGACSPCGDEGGEAGPAWVAGCPCVDIPLPARSGEPEAKPKAPDLPHVLVAGLPPARRAAALDLAPLAPARALPRPAAGLASIQTVVLRV